MVNYVGDGGDNTYTGTNLEDTLDGQGGADWLNAVGGHDSVVGGAGGDTLYGGFGRDTLRGGADTDLLYDYEDDDRDVLDGGDGDDFVFSAGRDNAVGGIGNDFLFLRLGRLGAVNVDLSSYTTGGSISVGGVTFSGFETGLIEVTDQADRVVAPNAPFRIDGFRGNDTLVGGANEDWLIGGGHAANDADVLRGEGGTDKLAGGLGDRLYGGDGVDDFFLQMQESIEEGGVLLTDPFDVDLSSLPTGGIVNMGYGGALAGLETGLIAFASGNDKIQLGLADVTIMGGDGNDTIIGGDGDDIICGDGGNDVLRGGAGVDTADYRSTGGGVVIDLNLTGWQATKGAGQDMLTGIEDVVGSFYNDRLTGNATANRLVGASGADILIGGQGDDLLFGNSDSFSSTETDRLTGGAGRDTLSGNGGDDLLVWASVGHTTVKAPDLITDLSDGDVIDLQGIDANTAVAGDQAFTLVASLTGAAGQLARVYDGSTTQFRMDVNGDGAADAIIEADGDHSAHDDWVL